MSHASVIVALSKEDVEKAGDVEEAVKWQMEPFKEGGEWFKDGSRWDWYQIGGRYTGKFLAGYDPELDPANQERCDLCGGTGRRDDMVVRNGCNACNGKGRKTKWPTEWANVGNVTTRAELGETEVRQGKAKNAKQAYAKWLKDERKDEPFIREHVYGIEDGESREEYVQRMAKNSLTAYAFLKDRRWCENERLGWFGGRTATECERKADGDFEGRCIHEQDGAKIVVFGDEDERWQELYWARFVRNLLPETILVVVDFHV